MEWWNDGILVFKWILAILILSSILPVAGTLNQHCIILSEPQARTHYSTIPLFHHSNCERSELTCYLDFAQVGGFHMQDAQLNLKDQMCNPALRGHLRAKS